MGQIILVGVERGTHSDLRDAIPQSAGVELIDFETVDLAVERIERAVDVDALVLGTAVAEPVRMSQLVHRANQDVAINIISSRERLAGLQRAIQFSPFLGEDIACWPEDDISGLLDTLRTVGGRARRRQAHRATLRSLSRQQASATPAHAHVTQMLDRILEHAPIGVMTVDQHDEVLDANSQARQMLNLPASMAGEVPLIDLFPEHHRDDLRRYVHAARRGLVREGAVVVELDPSRSGRVIEVVAAPVSSRVGASGGLLLLTDITARVQAERRRDIAEQRLRFIADASRLLASSLDYDTTLVHVARLAVPFLADWCIVYLRDEDGGIRRVALEVVGATREGFDRSGVNRGSQTTVNPNARVGVPEVIRSAQSVLHPNADAELLSADVDRPEVLRAVIEPLGVRSWMCVPMFAGGQAIGAISFVSTTPDRHYDEDDLRIAEDLAQRAGYAIEHARLYQDVRDALQAREEFVSVAAHELRTPLTTIKAFGQLLERDLRKVGAASPRADELMSGLRGQIDRLAALVEDLLDASRLGQQVELRRERVDLVGLVRQVLRRFEHDPTRTSAHTLVIDAPDEVIGEWDESRLEQLIVNLVSNALKYSPDGGEICLAIGESDGVVEFQVSDQGIGIPLDEQEGLFQPFARGSAAAHGFPGTGLGLYVAAQIAQRHGGTIAVRSAVGAGTTFIVSLPQVTPGSSRER